MDYTTLQTPREMLPCSHLPDGCKEPVFVFGPIAKIGEWGQARYQHGANPEAVLDVGREFGTGCCGLHVMAVVAEWLDRIHPDYEPFGPLLGDSLLAEIVREVLAATSGPCQREAVS